MVNSSWTDTFSFSTFPFPLSIPLILLILSKKVPHMPTDWNSAYERNEAHWDRGRPTPVLEAVWEKHPDLLKGRVLVPGCGLGHDARWLADHGCQVVGADIAPLALERAKALDVEHRIDFRLVDLFDLPPGLRGSFDRVWEHTCLSALEPMIREQYLAGIKSALKPGAEVAGVFYINPDMEPGETGPPFGISVEELIALWEGAGFQVVEHWTPQVSYEGREGREEFMWLRLR
jgi:methyl halide transferase